MHACISGKGMQGLGQAGMHASMLSCIYTGQAGSQAGRKVNQAGKEACMHEDRQAGSQASIHTYIP